MTGARDGDRLHGGAYQIEATLDNGKGDAWLGHSNFARGFRAETAFRTRVDVLETWGGGGYRFDTARKVLTWIKPFGGAAMTHDHSGNFTDHWADVGLAMRLWRTSTLGCGVMNWHETYKDQRFDGGAGWTRLRSSAVDTVRWLVAGYVGTEVNYDPEDLFQGSYYELFANLHLRLFRRLTADLDVTHHAMFKPGGELQYQVQLVRTVLVLALRHDLWLRTVFDINTFREDLALQVLLSYAPHPGTAIYLGYSEGAAWEPGPLQARSRSVFVKLQVMVKPSAGERLSRW